MAYEKQPAYPGDIDPCLTLPQAAKLFNIPARALRLEIAAGNLKVVRIGTKRWRLIASDVVELIARKRNAANS
ncbi:helix-turn-helix domain-containing protein [Aestuariivirga sp.]|uniref:helix-turn-helix domain-containing protein n=1 Tax=Aestuariivirga sp. TaxID=2650926 RepID=UPI0039E44B20